MVLDSDFLPAHFCVNLSGTKLFFLLRWFNEVTTECSPRNLKATGVFLPGGCEVCNGHHPSDPLLPKSKDLRDTEETMSRNGPNGGTLGQTLKSKNSVCWWGFPPRWSRYLKKNAGNTSAVSSKHHRTVITVATVPYLGIPWFPKECHTHRKRDWNSKTAGNFQQPVSSPVLDPVRPGLTMLRVLTDQEVRISLTDTVSSSILRMNET